jgi:hypothetical protein
MHRLPLCPAGILLLLTAACAPAAGGRPSAAPPPAFRALVWNVGDSSFVLHPGIFRGVLRAADADVLILDEVGGEIEPAELIPILRGLRGEADTVWHLAWGVGGDYQRTVIASREPVEPLPEFSPLPFTRTTQRVFDRAPDSLHAKLRQDFDRGVATNGAVVRSGGRRLLVVGVDLWARGTPDSWEETRRRVEAATIRDAVGRVLARLSSEGRAVDGVVLGGDMNLVAGRAPLDTLTASPGAGWQPLAIAPALHADGLSRWTWDGRGTVFHSRQMDLMLYSPEALAVEQAHVFDSEQMPPAELARFGLNADASKSLSRHRPVVVDFRWLPARR